MILNIVLLFGISLAWAAGYLFISASSHIPAVTATAAMTVVAAAVVMPAVGFVLRRPLLPTLRRRPWVPMVMSLGAIALPNLAVVAAEHSVPSEVAALVGATVPIATILLTTFVTREAAFSRIKMLGILLALAGLVVFLGGREILDHDGELWGIAIMMSGGLVFAINGLFVARQTHDLDEFALAAWTVFFAALVLVPAAFIIDQPLSVSYGGAAWALVAEGVLGMGVAYVGYFALVARTGPGFASLYAFLVPPFGVLAGAVLSGHMATPNQLLGLALALLGLALMTRRRQPA